jgi:hypothetical protein
MNDFQQIDNEQPSRILKGGNLCLGDPLSSM